MTYLIVTLIIVVVFKGVQLFKGSWDRATVIEEHQVREHRERMERMEADTQRMREEHLQRLERLTERLRTRSDLPDPIKNTLNRLLESLR